MLEIEFIEAIDGSFCFDTDEEYEAAARAACKISDNTVLMVGYELASGSSHASLDVNLRLIRIMESERPTPVVLAAIPVIEALLMDEKVQPKSLERLLAACSEHSNAWNGLCIAECTDESLEKSCDAIRKRWRLETPKESS
jgi:hypothetical protein